MFSEERPSSRQSINTLGASKMDRKQWLEAKEAWEKIKDQGRISVDEANLFIEAINTHLNSLPVE